MLFNKAHIWFAIVNKHAYKSKLRRIKNFYRYLREEDYMGSWWFKTREAGEDKVNAINTLKSMVCSEAGAAICILQ